MHTRATQQPALRARVLEVRYADRIAVHPVDLDLVAGELVAVTGPSGAGKTSLLWALAGAQTAYDGVVEVGGAPIASRRAAAALGVALVPQGNGLLPALTATENLLAALDGVGLRGPDARVRARESLSAVGLVDVGEHLVEELSGGQQQRVAVARGVALAPTVLLADEPTSELDATSRALVTRALRDLARAGTAVAMSTHDPVAADEADAELALDEGRATWRRPRAGS